MSLLLMMISMSCLGRADGVAQGTEWFYDVEIKAEQGEAVGAKGLLAVVCTYADAERIDCFWHVEQETGRQLPFPRRVGIWSFDRATGIVEQPTANLGIEYLERAFEVALPIPFLKLPEDAAVGSEWQRGGAEWRIDSVDRRSGRECFRILVDGAFGRQSTVWVDAETHLLMGGEQRVFIGQGVPYQMSYELNHLRLLENRVSSEMFPILEQFAKAIEGVSIEREANAWNPEPSEREAILSVVEVLDSAEKSDLGSGLIDDARQTLVDQSRRNRSIDQMREQIVGKAVPQFSLETSAGESVTSEGLEGKVVVMHFWKYRNENLDPPYGQVGFLDFLARRAGEDFAFLGIAQLAPDDDLTRRSQEQSVKKFAEFMNLSYPIGLDDGTLLKAIGDPRLAREPLPLWIVVGADGKVKHYRPGLFDLDPREGLRELDEIIKQVSGSDE